MSCDGRLEEGSLFFFSWVAFANLASLLLSFCYAHDTISALQYQCYFAGVGMGERGTKSLVCYSNR